MTSTNSSPHAPGHVAIVVPPGWRRRSDPDRSVLVAARPPGQPASGVRPELVLTCRRVDADLATWRAAATDELGALLEGFESEDDDEYDLFGQPVAYHRFSHRVGTADVLCDQWAWLLDGVGVTLTCSCARVDYLEFCDVFERVAESVDLLPLSA